MKARHAGFSLIELLVALLVSALVVGIMASILLVPAQAHHAQARRSELASSAESVTHWMSQDVHRALPNSLRAGVIGGRAVVEMIDFAAVEIYRDAGVEGDPLVIDPVLPPDTRFDVLGLPGAASTAVVINNLGIPGQDAYEMANVIVAAPVDPGSATIDLADPSFRFAAHSPLRRVFLVSPATAVVRFECDPVARTLRRYDGLPVTNAFAALPGGTPSRLIASDVTACTFTSRPGDARHGGLLLLQVTVSRVTNGVAETLRIMQQLKVEEAA
jgi:MSHA biogenesis protein MshO